MATPFPFGSGNVLTAAQMNAITTLAINDQTASYVAVVGDVGKRIVMNVGSANTVTINNSIFAAGDTIFIANKGAGSTTVTAGAGVTINTVSSLVLAQHAGGTLVALSASVFTFFPTDSAPVTAPTIAIFNESQAANTNGGTSVANTYTKRTLNTTVINNIGATLTSSVIALLAGTYNVSAISTFFLPAAVAIRLRNTTDSTTAVAGVNGYASASSAAGVISPLQGTFTITATKNFEVQYFCTAAQASNGLGVAINSAGVNEIYTQITIEKTA